MKVMFLYAKLRPCLNKVATPDFSGRCSTDLVPLLPREGVDRDFVAWLLRCKETVDYVMASVTGSRVPRTDMKALMSLPVPLPPLDEQRQIVGIVNRAAKIERLRARAEERLREFVPALFVRMFGDPAQNPMGWEVRTPGECCASAQYGTSKKASERTGGIPTLRMGNITYDGYLDCGENKLKYVELEDGELKKYELRAGDILFNRTNSKELVGKTGIWDGRFEAAPASYFIRLRVDEAVLHSTFVWALMNSSSMKRRLFDMARGAIGQANINAKEVKSILLPVPPLALQKKFANSLKAMRSVTGAVESGSRTASALTASLMSRLPGAGA